MVSEGMMGGCVPSAMTKINLNFTDAAMSVFDWTGFELDKNYFKVEPSLVCHAKESVQVSRL